MIHNTVITDIEEETEDIDWFAADRAGSIAHFASGGRGFIPASIKASKEDLTTLQSFFRGLSDHFTLPVVSNIAESRFSFRDEAQRARYLEDFLRMAAKGLYSFDCVVEPIRASGYFLVATPTHHLNVFSLPIHIQSIIGRTVIEAPLPCCHVVPSALFRT
jgi:hypothetical protein